MTSLIKYITQTVLFITVLYSCNFKPGHQVYTIAEELLAKGELTEAKEVSEEILKSYNLSQVEKAKIDSILEMVYRIRIDFTLSDSDVLRKLVKYHPNINENDLLDLEKANKLDVRKIDGEKKYFKNCVRNLFLLDSAYSRLRSQIDGVTIDSLSIFRVENSSNITAKTETLGQTVNPVKMRLSYSLKVQANAVPPGETIRCWMPYPRENHTRQQDIRLISTNPVVHHISPASDLQRSIYLEKVAVANLPSIFQTVIEYTSYAQSFQLSPEMIKPYQKQSALYREFTAQRPPQIIFNERIKAMSKSILQDETNPLLQVKKLYQWINDSITWASALEYSIIPDIPGFVLDTRHGDCGMQTLLFMTLARSAGIPVKWQSGWMLHPGEVNLHDWCEVWYEGIGWVPLDQSFGLQDSHNQKIRDFYMTGIDAYRFIVNDEFGKPFTPMKKYFRSEPYDFQRGEVEWNGGNLYFDKWSWHMEVAYD